MRKNRFYVYVYIDPRNNEEFYYGKGQGSRKEAHLKDASDTLKAKRIKDIEKEGLSPIIRVIVRDLTQKEAFLVEKTLLWKLGKLTTNKATGHFAKKFRPQDTLHKELCGFDYENGIYYYNVGEGIHRNWDDYVQFCFISAGQGLRWRNAILGFSPGDIFAAYLKRRGYVGVGRILAKAKMVKDVQIKGKPLLSLSLRCKRMSDNSNNKDLSEYVCPVEWIKAVRREDAIRFPGIYTSPIVRTSLEKQVKTIRFIEDKFCICIKDGLI